MNIGSTMPASVRSFSALFLLMLLSASLLFAADSEPTLEETINFIREKINAYDKLVDDQREVTFSKDDSVLTIRSPRTVAKLHMSDCDPNRVTVKVEVSETGRTDYWVRLVGTNDKAFTDDGSRLEIIRVANREDAERTAKAFRHLIEICGGKKSLF
jgi:hypothetical protein